MIEPRDGKPLRAGEVLDLYRSGKLPEKEIWKMLVVLLSMKKITKEEIQEEIKNVEYDGSLDCLFPEYDDIVQVYDAEEMLNCPYDRVLDFTYDGYLPVHITNDIKWYESYRFKIEKVDILKFLLCAKRIAERNYPGK